MKLGRNCQGKMLARAGPVGCKVTWFTAAKRLLYGEWSKLILDPLYLETKKNAAYVRAWLEVV